MKRWDGFNAMLRFNKQVLKVFTAEQGDDIFANHRLILAFVPLSGSRALLSGAFINKGAMTRTEFEQVEGYAEYADYRQSIGMDTRSTAPFCYDFEVCQELQELFDRLIIDWGGSAISWYQNKVDKDISEILPLGFVMNFPGWEHVNITHQELQAIVEKPSGNADWKNFLQSHDGVYLILDSATGLQYIGSATGDSGLWGRWSGYANTGHNGNLYLEKLLTENGSTYARNFSFSLHHVFARGSVTEKDVLFYESLLKKKLGSRAFGLNAN